MNVSPGSQLSGVNPVRLAPSRNLLLEIPSAELSVDQRRQILAIIHEQGKELAEEKGWIVGRRVVDQSRLDSVNTRIEALERRLSTEFGRRPELIEHFREVSNQYMDRTLLQMATGEMRVLGRERRESMGLDRDGNESGSVANRDQYLDRRPIVEMLGRHSRARAYLLGLEQSMFERTDREFQTARDIATKCWESIAGIGFNGWKFRHATANVTRYQLDLVYRYYARQSGGTNLMVDLQGEWCSRTSDQNLISFSNPKFSGSGYFGRDPLLFGIVVDADHLLRPYLETRDFGSVTEALLSKEPADVVAARLYMSLHGSDALAVAIECFLNVRDEDRHRVLRAFHRRFGKAYAELAGETCELEEGIAVRHLSSDAVVNEWEITRVVNYRAKRIGTELGQMRARESGEQGGAPLLEERFQRTVLDLYRNNPQLVVRDERLRAEVAGKTLAELQESTDPRIRQVVAQVNRRIELLTQIKDAQARVAHQTGMNDVVSSLQRRLTIAHRTPPESGNKKHLEEMLRERIEEYYRKNKSFLDADTAFADALRRSQARVERETEASADRITKAMADIEAGTQKWYAFGSGLFTDNDKVFGAVRSLIGHDKNLTKEDLELLSLWYERKHGQSLRTLFRNEFAEGAELDRGNALLDGNLPLAAAAAIAMNATSWWENLLIFGGPNSKKIEGYIKDVPPEERHKISEYFDKRYARLVTYTEYDSTSLGITGAAASESGPRTRQVACTSLQDMMTNVYSKDDAAAVNALLKDDMRDYRMVSIHRRLVQWYFINDRSVDIGKLLEEFYEDSPFELDSATGEWKLTEKRAEEIRAFITDYNRRYKTDLLTDIDKRCTNWGYTYGSRWCRALLEGNLAEANAHKFRVAQSIFGNDRRMMLECTEVSAQIRALPDTRMQELNAQGRGSEIANWREHDALVERRERAIACQRAMNARMEQIYGELHIGRNFRADLRHELKFAILWVIPNNSDGELLNAIAVRRLDRGIGTDTERLIEETQYATWMSGVDGAKLAALTHGKTKAQIAEMEKEAAEIFKEANCTHASLADLATSKLSGDHHFEVGDNFRGLAETGREMAERALERVNYERSGLLMWAWPTQAMDKRYAELKRFVETIDQNKKLDDLNARDRARLKALNHNFQIEAENFRTQKNSLAELATTFAVIAVSVAMSVASFGTASPWLTMYYVTRAALLTTFITKALVRGAGFVSLSHRLSVRELLGDVVFSVLDGALSAAAGHYLTEFVDSAMDQFAKAFANSWVHNCIQYVGILRGLRPDTIQRALAAEKVIGRLMEEMAKATTDTAKQALLLEMRAVKAKGMSLLLEHARALTIDVATSWASSGIQTAVNGGHESFGDYLRSWGEATGERLRFGVLANIASTRLLAANEWLAVRHADADVWRKVNRHIAGELIAQRRAALVTPTHEPGLPRRSEVNADPAHIARGLAAPDPTPHPTPSNRTVHDHLNDGHRAVARHESELRAMVEGKQRGTSGEQKPLRRIPLEEARTGLGLKADDPSLRDAASFGAKKAEMIREVPARATDPEFLARCASIESELPVGSGRKRALADLNDMGFVFGKHLDPADPKALASEHARALAHAEQVRNQVEAEISRILGAGGAIDLKVVREVLRRFKIVPEDVPHVTPHDLAQIKAALLDHFSEARVNHAFARLDAVSGPTLRAAALARVGLVDGDAALAGSSALRAHVEQLRAEPGANRAVLNSALEVLLRLVPPDTVQDAVALLRGRGAKRNPKLPTTEAELIRLGSAALKRAGDDPAAIYAVAVALQRLNVMVPATDVAATCRLIGGANWQNNPGFRSLLESRAALRAWFEILTRGAPEPYRRAAMKHFEALAEYVPPSTAAEARAHLGYQEGSRTRSELIAEVRARVAGPPPMEPAKVLATVRALEMALETMPATSLADHIYSLGLGDEALAARHPIGGTAFDAETHSLAAAKLEALSKLHAMTDTEAHLLLAEQRAAGALRDHENFDRHVERLQSGASPEEQLRITESAAKVREQIGQSVYHAALEEFGLQPGSRELTNQKELRAACKRRLSSASPEELPRLRHLQEILELHLPPSFGQQVLNWFLRRIGWMTLHDALTTLNLFGASGLSPDALTPEGLQLAHRAQRAAYERHLAEAPTSSAQHHWNSKIAELDRAYGIASAWVPFGTNNREIRGALSLLRLPEGDSYSAVSIDRAANSQIDSARGHPERIAEINGARNLLKSSLPDLPARSWYDLRAYTTDLIFGRSVRGFHTPRAGALQEHIAAAGQRIADCRETFATFGIGADRKVAPTPQQVLRMLKRMLAQDPNPANHPRLRAMADLLIDILNRRSLATRLLARHVNADDLLFYAHDATQAEHSKIVHRSEDTRTVRIVREPTLAERTASHVELDRAKISAVNDLGLQPGKAYSAKEIEAARAARLEAAGGDQAALIRAQVAADLLLCLTGERPWSVARETPLGDGVRSADLVKTLTDVYSAAYRSRSALGMSIDGNPFAISVIRAGLDGIDIVQASERALARAQTPAEAIEILAHRDFLLALNEAHSAPWWSFGMRTTQSGGGESVPSFEKFKTYHESRYQAHAALELPFLPRDGAPLHTEADLATALQRRLASAKTDAQRAEIIAAHEFLVADLRTGTTETRYTAKWRAYSDTIGAPISQPLQFGLGLAVWSVRSIFGLAWGLVISVLPGSATVTALGAVQRLAVHLGETIYGVLPAPLQYCCDLTFGNLRRAWWAVEEWSTTRYRQTGALLESAVEGVTGRRMFWSGDPTIESFAARVHKQQQRLLAVRQAELFLEAKSGAAAGSLRDLSSLNALDQHVDAALRRASTDRERLRIRAARDQLAQDIVFRQTGAQLHHDVINAAYYSGRAYLIDYMIKLGAIRALLAMLGELDKLKKFLASLSVTSDGHEDCESAEALFGVTPEDAAADPCLLPFVLADQTDFRAETPVSMVEMWGGARMTSRDRALYERAIELRRQRDTLARSGSVNSGRFNPAEWNVAMRVRPVRSGILSDTPPVLQLGVGRDGGLNSNLHAPNLPARPMYEDDLAAAILPPKRATTTRLSTGFEPSVATFRAASPSSPMPLQAVDRAYQWMTLDLPNGLQPVSSSVSDVVSRLVVRPFSPGS